jgi:hypothetical protein
MPRNDYKVTLIRSGDKEAFRFVTPEGVTAVVATSVNPDLMRMLKAKLERKLRRRGIRLQGSA